MLQSLRLEQFRNFNDSQFSFAHKTAIVGNNGVGKSNLIEAIRLLSIGKSFKTNRLDEAIAFGKPFFRLGVERANKLSSIEFFYGMQFSSQVVTERQLKIGGKETNWADFWGSFPTVLFIPTDVDIVLGAPLVRRRYIDGLLWQTDREFRQSHLEIAKVLRERSALLFLIKINRAAKNELQPWDELLVNLTAKIRKYRGDYINFLQQSITDNQSVFTSGAKVEVKYKENKAEPETVFKEEVRLAQNLVGPHRDELEIEFNDQSARRYTSRGQARAIVLSLKIAEATFLRDKTGKVPTILLDDMFSELDAPTSSKLFGLLAEEYQLVASSIEPNQLIKGWETITL